MAMKTARRGYDLGLALDAKILRMPIEEGRALIFILHFGKTLRKGAPQAAVVKRDRELPQICAVRALDDSVSTAGEAGWDVHYGYLFPGMYPKAVSWASARQKTPLPATSMTRSLQVHLTAAELPDKGFMMHSFRVTRLSHLARYLGTRS